MRAFALKSDITDFAGGQIALPPEGKTLDVGRRLGDSGVIVVNDDIEAQALATFPALKELQGDERDQAVQAHGQKTAEAAAAEATSKSTLVARAKELGVSASGNKDEIQARITEAENSKGGDD